MGQTDIVRACATEYLRGEMRACAKDPDPDVLADAVRGIALEHGITTGAEIQQLIEASAAALTAWHDSDASAPGMTLPWSEPAAAAADA